MNLVFCMAGLYKRFRDAGYATPKFLLPFQGRTTLAHVVQEMVLSPGSRGVFQHVVCIANQRDYASESAIQSVLGAMDLAAHGVRTFLAWVPDTRGQAHTASLGVDELEHRLGRSALTQPVLFHNIDTILIGRDYKRVRDTLLTSDGYIDCIDSEAPQYSYVVTAPHEPSVAIDVREKVVLSRHATTGLYGFRSAEAYRSWAQGVDYTKEFYISDVYRAMLRAGKRVIINTSNEGHRTIIVGTPAEYEALATIDEVAAARRGVEAPAR
ncbi:MAG: hypothetical protein U0637_08505 [Phycisphaerales bacterium]